MNARDIGGLICFGLFGILLVGWIAYFVYRLVRKTRKAITLRQDSARNERIRALERSGDVAGLAAILQETRRLDPMGAGALAAAALGAVVSKRRPEQGRGRITRELVVALAGGSDAVRAEAAAALGQAGDPQAVPALEAALKDPAQSVSRNAAVALGQLAGPVGLTPQTAAAAVSSLKDELPGSPADRRRQIVLALDGLGWQPDQSPAAAAYWVEKRNWEAAMRLGSTAVSPLIAALIDPDSGVRLSAASALKALLSGGNLQESTLCINERARAEILEHKAELEAAHTG
jgi:HEAT repeat protein